MEPAQTLGITSWPNYRMVEIHIRMFFNRIFSFKLLGDYIIILLLLFGWFLLHFCTTLCYLLQLP